VVWGGFALGGVWWCVLWGPVVRLPAHMYISFSLEDVGPRPNMAALTVVVTAEGCGNANANAILSVITKGTRMLALSVAN